MQPRRGFTMLELLVTMGIIGIIASFGLPAFQNMQRNLALNAAAQDVADALRTAQTRAISSQAGADHGVRVFPDHLEMYNTANADVQTRAIDGGMTLAGTNPVLFNRLSGTIASTATITVTGASQTKTIVIQPNGKMTLD